MDVRGLSASCSGATPDCKGEGNALSHFGFAGPMTEAILLGNVALRTQEKVEWNARQMRVTNSKSANDYVKKQYRKGWELPS